MSSSLTLSSIFVSNLIELFPIVKAQTVDATAQPTFGAIEVNTDNSVAASMLIRSDKTSVNVGDTFTATVEIKTNAITISEYRIVIDYDATKLSVVDQDTSTPGTQIKLTDTVFTVANPGTDNTAASGRIILDAKVASGNAFAVNRDVAQIQFQAQAAGSPTIKVTKDTGTSRLVRQSGSEIGFTNNQFNVQITTATGAGGTTSAPPPIAQTTTTTTSTTGGTTSVTTIPVTGVADDIGSAITVIVAGVLILTGLKLSAEKRKKNEI